MNDGTDILINIIMFILAIAIVLGVMFGLNSCTADTWNNGNCIKCETRYELRGVSRGWKYYACPNCGQEVQRLFY